MIYAEYKNKGNQRNLGVCEDILTSNVFFLFEMLNDKILLKVLSNAENISKEKLLFNDEKKIKKYELWKRNEEQKEPEIYFENNNNKYLIEVKYLSEESGENQLKNYLDTFEPKALIYLTRGNSNAKKTIEKYKDDRIYWLSWEKVNESLEKILLNNDYGNETEKKIIKKISEYLHYKGFKYWKGWSQMEVNEKEVLGNFFKFNADINELFNNLENGIKNKSIMHKFEILKKNKNSGFYDDEEINKDKIYIKHCYVKNEKTNEIRGFTFYIS